jgi:hypothetical protein
MDAVTAHQQALALISQSVSQQAAFCLLLTYFGWLESLSFARCPYYCSWVKVVKALKHQPLIRVLSAEWYSWMTRIGGSSWRRRLSGVSRFRYCSSWCEGGFEVSILGLAAEPVKLGFCRFIRRLRGCRGICVGFLWGWGWGRRCSEGRSHSWELLRVGIWSHD